MLAVYTSADQTVEPGQAIVFDRTAFCTGSAEKLGAYPLNAAPTMARCGVYLLGFNANVGGTTAGAPVELTVNVDGVAYPDAAVISTPAAVGDLNHVSGVWPVKNCGNCCGRVTVVNTGDNPVVVSAGAQLWLSAQCRS